MREAAVLALSVLERTRVRPGKVIGTGAIHGGREPVVPARSRRWGWRGGIGIGLEGPWPAGLGKPELPPLCDHGESVDSRFPVDCDCLEGVESVCCDDPDFD